MNLDERRLKEIKEYKTFYQQKLSEGNTDLGEQLIQAKLQELTKEETEILKRCKVEL